MKIRTISQLPELQPGNQFPSDSLFEVSERQQGAYVSKNVRYGTLKSHLTGGLMLSVASTYQLTADDGTPESLAGTALSVRNVLSGSTLFEGSKRFAENVRCLSEAGLAGLPDDAFVTKDNVVELCRDIGNYLSPDTTYVDADPENDTPNTAFDENYFVKWQFDQDGRDSSEFDLDRLAGQKAGPVFAPATGNMVAYGWLADNGNVAAQEAWVGLFGRVTVGQGGTEKRWVALQVQPWVIGTKSQSLQYVGFNVPVRKGMQLKIMTGFPVNTMNSGFQDPGYNTLTFVSNQPCSFVGYVLRNDQ